MLYNTIKMTSINKTKKIFTFIKNDDFDLLRDIKEYFEEPKIFLKENPKIIIGSSKLKKIYKSKYKDKKNNNNSNNNKINENVETANNINNLLNMSSIHRKSNGSKDSSIRNKQINTKYSNENCKCLSGNLTSYKTKNNLTEGNKKIYLSTNTNTKGKNTFNKKPHFQNQNIYIRNNEDDFDLSELLENKTNKYKNIKTVSNTNKTDKTRKNTKRPFSVKNNIHYYYKTSEEICDYLSSYKNLEKDSIKKGTNYLIPKEVLEGVRKKFYTQEKKLQKNISQNDYFQKMSKYLSKKCRKNESNLLFNKIGDYRNKIQFMELLEKNKSLAERFGNYQWLIGLRRDKNGKEVRPVFVDISNNDKFIWKQILDLGDREVEIINNPQLTNQGINMNKYRKILDINQAENNIFNHRNIKTNINTKSNTNTNTPIPNISPMTEIKVEGKNIINQEKNKYQSYKNIFENNYKFRVYKDPREEKLKNVQDCSYKINYEYEGIPKKCFLDSKSTKTAHKFSELKKNKGYLIKHIKSKNNK